MKKKNGFSLIELIVVIVIIGILSVFVRPKLFSTTEDRKVEVIKTDIQKRLTKVKTMYLLEGGITDNNGDGNVLDDLVSNGDLEQMDTSVFYSPSEITYEIRYVNEEGSISLRLVLETTNEVDQITIDKVVNQLGISENNYYTYTK